MSRLYLSPPHMSGQELVNLREAYDSNWIAPLGPHVDAFEEEAAKVTGVAHAAALSSGTAAIHLALIQLGVGSGDRVICSDLTFAASAFAIRHVGADPIFIDAERSSWNLDPGLLAQELEDASRKGRLPKAAIVVDLYGQSAAWDPILAVCEEYGVAVIEDAAEALGASYGGKPLGGFGHCGVLSFNGNKIITTSGGGMLLSDDRGLIEKTRKLATQAREPAPHYEHAEIGYNYRMSNLLAAVGRGQLRVLEERVEARRRVFSWYEELLGDLPGLEFLPEADYGRANRWLTCLTVDPENFGVTREDIRLALEVEDIEARPVWKPMHMQPVFSECRIVGGAVGEGLFEYGLCLPSGSAMSREQVERVSNVIRRLSMAR